MKIQSDSIMKVLIFIIVTFVSSTFIPVSGMARVWEVTADSLGWIAQVDSFKTITAGDTIMFVTSGGIYSSPKDITLPKVPLVLMAKPGLSQKPLICSAYNQSRLIKIQASATFKGLRFRGDGILDGTPYGIRFAADGNYLGTVRVEDCEFSNLRLRGIHMDVNNYSDSLIVNNCIFREIGETGIRYTDPARTVGVVKVTNCTFYKIGEQAIRLRNAGEMEVSHCTFFFSDSTISNRSGRAVYAQDDTVVVIRDNIFTNIETIAVRVYGPSPIVEYNLFWECGENIVSENDSNITFPIFNFEADPLFKDTSAVNLNLALDGPSPAIGVASDGTNLGDPRWGTWRSSGIWEVIEDTTNWVAQVEYFRNIDPGNTIMFVTDGGLYRSPKDITLPKIPLVLMSQAGLSKKPLIYTTYNQSRIIKIQASAIFKGLRFRGDGIIDGTPYGIRFAADGNNLGTVRVEDCEFSNLRLRGIHMDVNNYSDSLIVNNCIFREIGETGIRYTDPVRTVGVVKVTNCTFYKIGEQGIRLRNAGEMEVSHCTFFFSDSTISNRSGRAVYAQDDTVVVIRDNIFSKIETRAVRVYGPSPIVEYNLFWECGENIVSENDSNITFPIFNFEADPLFKDTSAVNLNLALEKNSPAVGVASDGTNLGDLQWGTWESTGVGEYDDTKPKVYRLSQNYPNPFNPSTTIEFDVVDPGQVSLTVYNILGKEVATLVDRQFEPGYHSISWKADGLTSGVYFYKIKVNNFVKIKKMIILK